MYQVKSCGDSKLEGPTVIWQAGTVFGRNGGSLPVSFTSPSVSYNWKVTESLATRSLTILTVMVTNADCAVVMGVFGICEPIFIIAVSLL